MSAIRLARGATGRDARSSSSPAATTATATACWSTPARASRRWRMPGSAGVTAGAARDTIVVPYNDPAPIAAAFEAHPDQIARSSSSPSPPTWASIAPDPGFLEALRELTAVQRRAADLRRGHHRASGVAHGGAQERYGDHAGPHDAGQDHRRRDAGRRVRRPGGPDGATSPPRARSTRPARCRGHPLTMAAGIATLDLLTPDVYEGARARPARARGGAPRGGRRGRARGRDHPGRLAAHRLLPVRRAHATAPRRSHVGPRRLRALLRRDARRGRPAAAVAVRGVVHLGARTATPRSTRRSPPPGRRSRA